MRANLACAAVLAALLAGAPTGAQAWKPSTHVALAELALQDALDDGHITLMHVDPHTGEVVGELGRFPVDPAVLAALRAAPDRFRAGVVGPDAYPDLFSGQQIIHPRVALDADGNVTGSDAWLRHLWQRSYGNEATSPAERAFVSGYLAHAAGDGFAHTYVNHYSGGEFTLNPAQNAVRHLVLEAYIDKRAPESAPDLAIGIQGVEDFIYREMIQAKPGSPLEQRLLVAADGPAPTLSIPLVFSRLRNALAEQVEAYETELASRRGWSRRWHRLRFGGQAEYRRRWIEDIDRGLVAWPAVSAEVSAALLYGSGEMDIERAKLVLADYRRNHLWSMAGAPDAAVTVAYAPSRLAQAILPEAVRRQLEAIVEAPFEAMLKAATTMNSAEWAAYLSSPEIYFDRVLDRTTPQADAHAVSLARFNREQLEIEDDAYRHPEQRWRTETFAPAFNTVQLTKLSFLSPEGLTAVNRALGGVAPDTPPANVMLGWIGSMDASAQWRSGAGSGEAWFAGPGVFAQLFQPHFDAP